MVVEVSVVSCCRLVEVSVGEREDSMLVGEAEGFFGVSVFVVNAASSRDLLL